MKTDQGLQGVVEAKIMFSFLLFKNDKVFDKVCHCLKNRTHISSIHFQNIIIQKCIKVAIANYFQNALCMI